MAALNNTLTTLRNYNPKKQYLAVNKKTNELKAFSKRNIAKIAWNKSSYDFNLSTVADKVQAYFSEEKHTIDAKEAQQIASKFRDQLSNLAGKCTDADGSKLEALQIIVASIYTSKKAELNALRTIEDMNEISAAARNQIRDPYASV